MAFGEINFETILSGGSLVNFKKREKPMRSEEEREIEFENIRNFEKGVRLLRKMKSAVFEQKDRAMRLEILREAHGLCDELAETILSQELADKPVLTDHSFVERLSKISAEHGSREDSSSYGIPVGIVVKNLLNAVDDILVRIEEKSQSLASPEHKLGVVELEYVLSEFLRGTNNLTMEGERSFFESGTKMGGILSGGAVYLALVKKIIEKYADPNLSIKYFTIAVDKSNKRTAFELNGSDKEVRNVLILDDMIDKGGTVLTALWAAGEYFPNATVRCGMKTDHPGGFEVRRSEECRAHIVGMFQEYADLESEGRDEEALALFETAEKYAKEHEMFLTKGWYILKSRIDERKTLSNSGIE